MYIVGLLDSVFTCSQFNTMSPSVMKTLQEFASTAINFANVFKRQLYNRLLSIIQGEDYEFNANFVRTPHEIVLSARVAMLLHNNHTESRVEN